jgi:hypothetical protein
MNTNSSIQNSESWPGDVLDRKPLGDHLTLATTALVAQRTSSHNSGVTVSLDAKWGAGKTFFVKAWKQDLVKLGHPVVYFDAWQNDIGDEPSIALMAAVNACLTEWKKKLPHDKAVNQKAAELTAKTIRRFRQAILPTSAVILRSVIKKGTGIAMDEIIDAFDKNDDSSDDDAPSGTSDALDKIFEEALKTHQARQESIDAFRSSVAQVIDVLAGNTDAQIPLYVFIDELDRCRPSYSIKLLEEVKHLFGIRNVCFVISTNLEQLCSSIKAVYGSDFDAHLYLKRLFDRSYTLPEPDHEKFAAVVIHDQTSFGSRQSVTGLPRSNNSDAAICEAFSLIARAFDLDLRSQKQVVQVADDAASGVPQNQRIHLLWLLFLAALNHAKPSEFTRLLNALTDSEGSRIISTALQTDPSVRHIAPADGYGARSEARKAPLSDILTRYYQWSICDAQHLMRLAAETDVFDYPSGLVHELIDDFGGRAPSQARPSIATYATLVRNAGYVTARN